MWFHLAACGLHDLVDEREASWALSCDLCRWRLLEWSFGILWSFLIPSQSGVDRTWWILRSSGGQVSLWVSWLVKRNISFSCSPSQSWGLLRLGLEKWGKVLLGQSVDVDPEYCSLGEEKIPSLYAWPLPSNYNFKRALVVCTAALWPRE